mmetsp:Transcript_24185/g.37703  ORF Transcript_24185/g.37703 Transcript_24185/m.37703 type:complete len:310 (-) Transcript_24185:5-934(-)
MSTKHCIARILLAPVFYHHLVFRSSARHCCTSNITSTHAFRKKDDCLGFFYAASQTRIFVPPFGKSHRKRIASGRDVDGKTRCVASPDSLAAHGGISEEVAWENVRNKYKFFMKPSHLTWREFLEEQTKYEMRWRLLSSRSQMMSLTINENRATVDFNSGSTTTILQVICDCSQHHTMNDLLGAVCQHWHEKGDSHNSAIRIVDDTGIDTEIIFCTAKGISSLFFLGKRNLVDPQADRCSIISSISLATFTRLVLESIIILLNDESFGFPNYKLCPKSHIKDIHEMWGALRAAACLTEEPLPIAFNQLN